MSGVLSRAGLALLPAAVLAYALTPGAYAPGSPNTQVSPPEPFKLEKGDHLCIIGNTLAERMQHDGWLEAYLHARHPQHELVIRNLGFSGDEVGGYTGNPDFNKRLRSADFGTADQWLSASAPIPQPQQIADKSVVLQNRFEKANTRADVIFAFFGYNESWAGEAGLPAFKRDLEAFVKHVRSQKYNGKSAPRLVLFSPTAFEDHKSPNLPRGTEQNKNLELYTAAMAEVAQATGVGYVDVLHPTRELYTKAGSPLTINGVHLTPEGYRQLAAVIDHRLFQPQHTAPPTAPANLEAVRTAVLDKNAHWYQRYRATDGFSVFGGRAWLKFVGGQTNYEVGQRELEILDVMTSNRDKVIWAAAQGKTIKPDDSNLPPFVPVTTNKPGKGPNGTHLFVSGEDAVNLMTVGKGLKVTLFADEAMFPELVNPVQMAWDTKGRLWVAVWPTYPHWKPGEPMNDKLLILEDTNGDGKADKCTVFADGLHNPTGFEFYNGGVIVAQAPDLVFLKDSKGGDRADVRERIIHGLDTADTHHTANSFVLDPGGALYFQEGTFHHSQVEDAYGPPKRVANGSVFRYEPRTQKFDVYVTYGFANPHGHVFDRWGQDIVIDGTGAVPYHAPLFSGHLPYPQKHKGPPTVYQPRTRPSGGMEVLSSRHFPPDFDGNLIVTNCIGFQGLLRYKLDDVGASLRGQELEPILASRDPNFRPVDCKTGPDGAIYLVDWHNPIIGHMQHNLRDPSRDRTHGRVYKVTYEGRPLTQSPKVAGEPIPALLELLKHPDDRVRYRAKVELGGRNTDDVMRALKGWVQALDPKDPEAEHHRLEALWLRQYHNVVDVQALEKVLRSPDFRARAAAVRVLCYQRDRIPEALDLLKALAADEHPRVRLEAVRAASFFTQPEAAEVVFVAQGRPTDLYIDHVIGETMKALDPMLRRAIAEKRPIKFTTPAGMQYLVKMIDTDTLLKMDRGREVNAELLLRPGLRDDLRRAVVAAIATAEKKAEIKVLLDAINYPPYELVINSDAARRKDVSIATALENLNILVGTNGGLRLPADLDNLFVKNDKGEMVSYASFMTIKTRPGLDESVAFDLVRLLTSRPQAELALNRDSITRLATTGYTPLTRQLGFVALVAADGAVDPAWALAVKSVSTLKDLVAAVPMVRDPGQRAALYPKVEALLGGLPPELRAAPAGKQVTGRFVRVELPGKLKTLTLAEVEVYSDGKNVARQGKASQSTTAHGGVAGRGIDGNKSGTYGDGGQTHTNEGDTDPWWEVDFGREYPVEQVVVYNRTDGNLVTRLRGFTVKVLDAKRAVTFESRDNPAPAVKAEFAVGAASPERQVRRGAMLALTGVRGKEADAFKALAKFLTVDAERQPAAQALLRIPPREWPKDAAPELLPVVMKYVRGLPVEDRTSPVALDMMQLGEGLANQLPADQARAARKELSAIGVRVIRVGTLTDQMLFDKDRIAVQAGKPVEFVFENTDIMPHNFVITSPGALEEVGNAAEAFGTQPGAAERNYVPPSNKVLLASKLLQPREGQQLRFTAPKEPGIYPYVCTYPGHWRRMHGALYVVADLDDYLADPAGYIARNPLPVKDELLKFNRPRTEWKLEELADAVKDADAHGGRNFANGRQMFTVATCVACHKFGGQGNDFGPDLTKLDPKEFRTPADLLKHVLEPSLRIEDRYATWTLTLASGKAVTGMIVEEKGGVVKLIENPLASAKPLEIKAGDIETRKKAATSMMPKGLLDKLTKNEVLDLTAYVWAKADPKHKYFQGGHDHGHGHP